MGGLCRAGAAVRHRHRTLRAASERGYSVLEAAIILPVMIFLLMFIVQWAIVWHARSVAEAAAQEGMRSASGYQSSAAAGRADAQNLLRQTAPHALPNPSVTVVRSATTVTVKVHAAVMSVIPFSTFTVDETAIGPVETFVTTP